MYTVHVHVVHVCSLSTKYCQIGKLKNHDDRAHCVINLVDAN